MNTKSHLIQSFNLRVFEESYGRIYKCLRILDEKQLYFTELGRTKNRRLGRTVRPHYRIKDDEKYPKQTNEHNALADARWNHELYKFLENL